jgi:hypothetical protein
MGKNQVEQISHQSGEHEEAHSTSAYEECMNDYRNLEEILAGAPIFIFPSSDGS